MREINFRGKRVVTGEWVYGGWFREFFRYPRILTENNDYAVDPETVGQYTGLKDRDGVDIYEGDIITTDLERPYLIVEYRNGAFMLNCNDGLDDYYDIFFETSEEPKEVYKYGEVIGNIHDNPELMGEKK